MLENDYPLFLSKNISSKREKNPFTKASDMLIMFKPGNENESDIASSEDQLSLPRRKMGLSVMESVFKRGQHIRKKSLDFSSSGAKRYSLDNSSDRKLSLDFQVPKRVEKSENVPLELQGLLKEENAFGPSSPANKPLKEKMLYSTQPYSIMDNIKKRKEDIKNKAGSFLIKPKSTSTPQKSDNDTSETSFSGKPPTNNSPLKGKVTSDSILHNDRYISESTTDQSSLPSKQSPGQDISEISTSNLSEDPMATVIVLPPKIIELGNKISKMKLELESFKTELINLLKSSGDEEKIKNLRYLQRGVFHELQDKIKEKRNLEADEMENLISCGFVSIKIGESFDSFEINGKEFAVYPIHVTRSSVYGTSFWVIQKRYSQFSALHQTLKTKYPHIVNSLEMPGKIIGGLLKARKQMMENRRELLQKYLSSLLNYDEICKSVDFRKFICPPEVLAVLYPPESEDAYKKSFFKSLFSGEETSKRGTSNELNSSNQGSSFSSFTFSNLGFAGVTESLMANIEFQSGGASASNVIVDLLVELFELKERSNWLRRQAVVIFLHSIFGDTVERRTHEMLSWV